MEMNHDISSFYLERKQYLEKLKKGRDDSSPLYKRTVNILISENEKGLIEEIRKPFSKINKTEIDQSITEERFKSWLKENGKRDIDY